MGLLVEGKWVDRWYDTKSTGGHFKRTEAAFRNWITPDGSPGPSGEGGFPAASGRYHLFVSFACPWAHRTLIFRKLHGLESHIGVSVVHPFMGSRGWSFEAYEAGDPAEDARLRPDPVMGARFLHELYARAMPEYTGRVTVPVLWDLERDQMVSNESSEIIRMFNSAFRELTGPEFAAVRDHYPEALRAEIDEVNERVYSDVNDGVYRTGFATTQSAYDDSVTKLFEALDWLETRLSERRWLCGEAPTEADWRLFTTLIRFDDVYHHHFKCSRKRLRDFPNLFAHTRELYQMPGIAETVHFDHIRRHYYRSHETINPNRIVPLAPDIDWNAPHGRG